ncbi:GGDEF domain-containing protein [Actinoplanes sp. LDG1-06]|uniref:GGDEF domain-containing protein n=1 Tax=Paractinoplanes ovalisporus TaxID=2810368 RepID=A0ABS2AFZ8_9ACTN|nr:GGDEF domain-containing protein [Actinoplanes ovalisporus]MBM2618763.1 GGDEF domain-containing protein [Actinoplanes ovalisporus]
MGKYAGVSGLIAAIAALWFGIGLTQPAGPSILHWLPTLAAGAVLAGALWRTSRTKSLAQPARDFWRRLSYAAVAATVGLASQGYDVWQHPDVGGSHTPPVMIAGAGVAQLFIVYALLRLPIGDQRPGARLRLLLDAGTVMLAAAAFLWHFQMRHLPDPIASLILTVTGMIAVFSVMKVVLSGQRFVDGTSLRLLAAAVFVGTLAPIAQPLIENPHLLTSVVGNPTCFFVAVLAARKQVTAKHVYQARPDRPFSLAPYAAVIAVQALLVAVAANGTFDDDLALVVASALVTALVAVRQLTALIDNGRLVRRLDHSATHDALTGLPNRALFQRRLGDLHDGPVAVALLDLDGFKQINDTLGHDAGDQLLIEVGRRLAAAARDGDTVARLGGDEFVIVLPGSSAADADEVVRRMMAALAEPIEVDGRTLPIGTSFGVTTGHGTDAGELLRQADIAMYAAKDHPGSEIVHYETGMAELRPLTGLKA